MKKASATSGVALAAFVIIVWSATFVNTKALLADFSALEILAIRFALAWVALWAIHPHGMGPLRVRDEALFAAAGLGGATVYQMLENVAIHFTNASNVGIRVATSSLFAAIMSRCCSASGHSPPASWSAARLRSVAWRLSRSAAQEPSISAPSAMRSRSGLR